MRLAVATIEVATPHAGADPARIAAALQISAPLAREIAAGSEFLQYQATYWGRLTPRPPTHCYTSPEDRVVSQVSALTDCDRRTPHPQWDHRELVKPDDETDPRYRLPTGQLLKLFKVPGY